MKTQHVRYISLLLSLCLLATLACQATSFLGSGDEADPATGDSSTIDESNSPEISAEAIETFELDPAELAEALVAETVDERPELMALLGRPDAFKMSLLDVEGGQVRYESWYYFQLGTQVDFVDGKTVWTLEVEPAPDGSIFPAWYDPLSFDPDIPSAEAIKLATEASPAGFAPETIDISEGGDDLAGGLILVGDQIVIGLQDDQVVYVETVPLFSEEGES